MQAQIQNLVFEPGAVTGGPAPPPLTFRILAENGDKLQTESGSDLRKE
jgi:hypothetical protein